MSLAGWAEIFVIALLAFVIIGPKDLPKFLFMLARFLQSIRRLSNEFMAEFESINYLNEIEKNNKKPQKKLNQKKNNADS